MMRGNGALVRTGASMRAGRGAARRGVAGILAILLAWVAGPASPSLQGPARGEVAPTLILVSFDGWRADYHTRVRLPNLERLMARGVRARHVVASYPTKTFPNHYTIVTGLYPGHHGIVANNIRDTVTGRSFSLSRRDEVQDPMWWGGEPIWVAAERAGLPTAPMFWPGSEAPIGGRHPTHWKPFDGSLPGSARVAQLLEWLDLPAERRPRFLTLYFEETDTAGHAGPELPALTDALVRVDGWLGELLAGLDRSGLNDRVNLVIVSDHGMSSTTSDRVVVIDDYVRLDDMDIVDLNPTLGLYPKAGKEESVYRALRRAHPRLRVYRRHETPKHWHYRDHPRIPPIVGVVDEGWQMLRRRDLERMRASGEGRVSGQHGYDPRVRSMRTLFVAAGPAFREGVVVPPFENVSIYNVLARVLGLTPAPNDGDPEVVRRLLK